MKIVTLFILLSFTLSAFGADPQVAFKKMKDNKAVIIDVREADEIRTGMVENAIWFPMSKIDSDKNWKKEFKKLTGDKEIYIYCHSGRRSERVRGILNENAIKSENIGGYQDLKNILPTSSK